MGAHLNLLIEIHNSMPAAVQGQIVVVGYALLANDLAPHMASIEPGPTDDPLLALRKVEMQRTVPIKDLPGYVEPRFEVLCERIQTLRNTGLLEGFLVTSIMDEVERILKDLADPDEAAKGMARRGEMKAQVREEMESDSSENAELFSSMLSWLDRMDATQNERLHSCKQDYESWRESTEGWFRKPRTLGCWSEMMRPN